MKTITLFLTIILLASCSTSESDCNCYYEITQRQFIEWNDGSTTNPSKWINLVTKDSDCSDMTQETINTTREVTPSGIIVNQTKKVLICK